MIIFFKRCPKIEKNNLKKFEKNNFFKNNFFFKSNFKLYRNYIAIFLQLIFFSKNHISVSVLTAPPDRKVDFYLGPS
jgi:hypothetical protein